METNLRNHRSCIRSSNTKAERANASNISSGITIKEQKVKDEMESKRAEIEEEKKNRRNA